MTVRASFSFRNQGGAPATGVRLRFNIPEGLVYLVGSGRLEDTVLDDELGNSPLLARAGAHLGDMLPGEERRIEIAYSVAGAIENGTTMELQAAVASFELPPVGSNVVRLVVRSKPQLRNPLTRITIEAENDSTPGSLALISVRMHNAGQSSAHDVVVVAPIPEHSTYVNGSARVNGRQIEGDLGLAFDRCYAPVVLRSLAANASATLAYRARIDTPLANETSIVARAQIASQETPAFALEPSALTILSEPSFANDRTVLSAQPNQNVRPGERVLLVLTAYNDGTADAQRLNASIELPDGLIAVRGSSTIDGRAARERRREPLRFAVGRIAAGDDVTLRIDTVVASPLANGTVLTVGAILEWEPSLTGAQCALQCALAIHSEPDFPSRRNLVERRGSEVVRPGDGVEATVLLSNDGSAAAHDGVLRLRHHTAAQELAVWEGNVRLALDGDTIGLGELEAHSARRLSIRARVPSPCANRSELRIGATLHSRELGETPLGEAFWRVDSHPAFRPDSSHLELADESALRPDQLAEIDVVLTNAGTDVAQNVSLRLYISPEARLESVDGATREKSSLLFGEIAPGARARARIGLRLLRSLAKDCPIQVDSVLTGDAMLPVPLRSLTIATTAEPDFSVGSFRSEPAGIVDVGETVEWILAIRNGGDGVAHRAHLMVEQSESLIYVPNSTTVNDVPVRDVGALPPFAAEPGIVLNEVDPGVEATIRWRTVVHNGVATNTSLKHLARIRYDGEREDTITSTELNARASPIFANTIAGLPFGLDGVLGPAVSGERRVLAADRFMELPPATPVAEGNGTPLHAPLAAVALEQSIGTEAGTLVAFNAERLSRTLRFLREARFGTLVTHLFAIRAFLPDAIGDAHCGALTALREKLHEELDRLFIKLRLPRYVIVPRDIETPSLRSTIERLLYDAAEAHGAPAPLPTASIELHGTVLADRLREAAERVASAALASAAPWSALSHLLPDEQVEQRQYRTALLDTLGTLEPSDTSDFIEALQHQRDESLDEALDAVTASLNALV